MKRSVQGELGRAGYEITVEGVFSAIGIETRPADKPEAAPSPASPASPSERPKPEAEPEKAPSPASPAPVRG